MPGPQQSDVTALLRRLRRGDEKAADLLVPIVYDELRRSARRLLRRERKGHSLQPTELVHEAYIRLAGLRSMDWQDRAHFFAMATTIMHRILVDHARRRGAGKRGGARTRITLSERLAPTAEPVLDLLGLDAALTALEKVDERRARVAAFRIFGGLNPSEISEVLGVSRRTVERDWLAARAWLIAEIRAEGVG